MEQQKSPNLDITFDGYSYHVYIPPEQLEAARDRFEKGNMEMIDLIEALHRYWLAEGGDLEELKNAGYAKW